MKSGPSKVKKQVSFGTEEVRKIDREGRGESYQPPDPNRDRLQTKEVKVENVEAPKKSPQVAQSIRLSRDQLFNIFKQYPLSHYVGTLAVGDKDPINNDAMLNATAAIAMFKMDRNFDVFSQKMNTYITQSKDATVTKLLQDTIDAITVEYKECMLPPISKEDRAKLVSSIEEDWVEVDDPGVDVSQSVIFQSVMKSIDAMKERAGVLKGLIDVGLGDSDTEDRVAVQIHDSVHELSQSLANDKNRGSYAAHFDKAFPEGHPGLKIKMMPLIKEKLQQLDALAALSDSVVAMRETDPDKSKILLGMLKAAAKNNTFSNHVFHRQFEAKMVNEDTNLLFSAIKKAWGKLTALISPPTPKAASSASFEPPLTPQQVKNIFVGEVAISGYFAELTIKISDPQKQAVRTEAKQVIDQFHQDGNVEQFFHDFNQCIEKSKKQDSRIFGDSSVTKSLKGILEGVEHGHRLILDDREIVQSISGFTRDRPPLSEHDMEKISEPKDHKSESVEKKDDDDFEMVEKPESQRRKM